MGCDLIFLSAYFRHISRETGDDEACCKKGSNKITKANHGVSFCFYALRMVGFLISIGLYNASEEMETKLNGSLFDFSLLLNDCLKSIGRRTDLPLFCCLSYAMMQVRLANQIFLLWVQWFSVFPYRLIPTFEHPSDNTFLSSSYRIHRFHIGNVIFLDNTTISEVGVLIYNMTVISITLDKLENLLASITFLIYE